MAIESDIDLFSQVTLQQANLWDFFIFENPVSGSVSNAASLFSPQNLGNLVQSAITNAVSTFEGMKFKVKTTNLPLPGLITENTKIGRKIYKERQYEGDFAVTMYEDILFTTYAYFDDWMKRVYNFDTQVWINPPPPNRTGVLIYWAGTNPDIPTATFTYENLKIKGIENISLTREASPLELTINLTFDKVSSFIGSSLANQLKNASFGVLSF